MNPLTPYMAWIKLAAFALIVAGAMWYSSSATKAKAERQYHKQHIEALEAARAAEARHAREVSAIAEKYEQDKRNAEADHGRLVAGLRAGTVRLRKLWQGCQGDLSRTPSGPTKSDEENRLREESVGRIIGAVRECQIQRDGLIDIVNADRAR